MQRHQLDDMHTIRTSLQTDNHTNTSSLVFYRPDALLAAQPTVPKHGRQKIELKANTHKMLFFIIYQILVIRGW